MSIVATQLLEKAAMAKSPESTSKAKTSNDFNSAKAAVWRELRSIREAATTGTIGKTVRTSLENRDRGLRSSSGSYNEKK
jgi:hypothetical protein